MLRNFSAKTLAVLSLIFLSTVAAYSLEPNAQVFLLRSNVTHLVTLGNITAHVNVIPPNKDRVSHVRINDIVARAIDRRRQLWTATLPVDEHDIIDGRLPVRISGRTLDGRAFNETLHFSVIFEEKQDDDKDGIPNDFDVDVDGDGIFDVADYYFDESTGLRLELSDDDDSDLIDDRLEVLIGTNPNLRDQNIDIDEIVRRLKKVTGETSPDEILVSDGNTITFSQETTDAGKRHLLTTASESQFEAPTMALSDGGITYTVPLEIPKGQAGSQPNLRLVYHSDAGNGIFGQGWSMPIPMIRRSLRSGIPKYDQTDTFEYVGDAGTFELVPTSNPGEYVTKVESTFTRFYLGLEGWIAHSQDGRTFKYGTSTNARMEGSSAVKERIAAWYLEEAIDLVGNLVRFNYLKDERQIYPNTITYNEFRSRSQVLARPAIYVIRFLWQDGDSLVSWESSERRPDIRTSFIAGFRTQMRKRVGGIEVLYRSDSGKEEVIRRWTLSYQYKPFEGVSQISSIQESGRGGRGVLPPLRFGYHEGDQNWVEDNDFNLPPEIGFEPDLPDIGARFCEINGDGFPDLIVGSINSQNQVYLNDTNGGWKEVSASNNNLPDDVFFNGPRYYGGYRIFDVNSDGLCDFIYSHGDDVSSTRQLWLNSGNGWRDVALENWTLPTQMFFENIDGLPTGTEIVDLNGDKFPDFIQKKTGNKTIVWLHTGKRSWQRTFEKWRIPDDYSIVGPDREARGIFFIDINGDGLDDLVRSREGESGAVLLNTGSGWAASREFIIPREVFLITTEGFPTGDRFLDLNSDGLPDILATDESRRRVAFLNTGNGWLQIDVALPVGASFLVDHNLYGTQLSDLNADTRPDLAQRRSGGYAILLNSLAVARSLKSLENGYGGEYRFQFGYSTHERLEPSRISNPDLFYPKQVLKKLEKLDLFAGEINPNGEPVDLDQDGYIEGYVRRVFQYSGAKYDLQLQEFAGFRDVIEDEIFSEPSISGRKRVIRQFYQDVIRRGMQHKESIYYVSDPDAPMSLYMEKIYDLIIREIHPAFC